MSPGLAARSAPITAATTAFALAALLLSSPCTAQTLPVCISHHFYTDPIFCEQFWVARRVPGILSQLAKLHSYNGPPRELALTRFTQGSYINMLRHPLIQPIVVMQLTTRTASHHVDMLCAPHSNEVLERLGMAVASTHPVLP